MVGTIKIWTRVVRGLEWVAAAEATLVPGIFDVETGHRDLLFRCNGMTSALELRCGDDAFAVWGEMRGFDGTRELLIRLGEPLGQLPNPPLEIPSTAQYFVLPRASWGDDPFAGTATVLSRVALCQSQVGWGRYFQHCRGPRAYPSTTPESRHKGTSKNAIFAHRRFRIGLTIC